MSPTKKVRKLFHLDSGDADFIKKMAKEKKVSESQVVRMAIRDYKKKEKADLDPVKKLIGTVKAGKNQARKHDEVIYE